MQVDALLNTQTPITLTFQPKSDAGSGQDNPQVDTLKCGRWAQNNDLYGGNALIPFLDFCQIAGNQCNPKGAAATSMVPRPAQRPALSRPPEKRAWPRYLTP